MLYRPEAFEPLSSPLCWNNTSSFADELHALVRANADNPADELMWGASGTMLAARALLDATGEERWHDAWRESASSLLPLDR